MISWHGTLFNELQYFWKNLRNFAFYNRSLFEILFIVIYTAEQAVLIWFTYIINNVTQLAFVVSIFALIVITTFSVHKQLMNSRIKLLEDEVINLRSDKEALDSSLKQAKKEFTRTMVSISEHLNNTDASIKSKKEVDR
ncbi:MAG: hypothetical protein Q8Q01_02450 [archaeon]|nr:hypothetical protein [archaeon]